ncbi:hypothetical protein [Streptacidiphilus jiangxiensis]|uniref:Uncharacterized protein n=1 Tax=Streptacidiphilus jiangxiensis TaxID=235985 RepID=A0A1H7WUI3_STRJI|nr:hypothetical protein [Streptacidiphilus jiangxiensis]SEM25270.1 hypothetical protein SAMN05414137_121168 [Streptacidiphilus jiangxiensis]
MRVSNAATLATAVGLAAAMTVSIPSTAQASTIVGTLSRSIYLAASSNGGFNIPYSGTAYWKVPATAWYSWSMSPIPTVGNGTPRSIYLAAGTYTVSCSFSGTGTDWHAGNNYSGGCEIINPSTGGYADLPYNSSMYFDIPAGTYNFETQLATA